MTKALVLAADNSYLLPLETVLKSVCRHNSGLVIYIFNQDISPEWMRTMARKVAMSGNSLKDVKLSEEHFGQDWHLLEHIDSLITYARYYIPCFVSEDRVLYLDCDTLVTGDLSALFSMDLQGYPLAAVHEAIDRLRFNAGVLLIDNRYWREQAVSSSLFDLTTILASELINGDQEVLNRFFEQQWLGLDETYNYQIGFDLLLSLRGEEHPMVSQSLEELPLIIHYLSHDKPWHTFSSHRLREIWWYYQGMDWSEILLSSKSLPLPQSVSAYGLPVDIVIVTDTQEVTYLEELLKAFPDRYFHVLAYTNMGPKLMTLSAYANLILHPAVTRVKLKNMLASCQLYLAIHQGNLFSEVTQELLNHQTPVFAFEQTIPRGVEAVVFDGDHHGLSQMIRSISEVFVGKCDL